jgi:hypothetical protein
MNMNDVTMLDNKAAAAAINRQVTVVRPLNTETFIMNTTLY